MKGQVGVSDGVLGTLTSAALNQLSKMSPLARASAGVSTALIDPFYRCSDYLCKGKDK
jgi:hypothetical protein